MPATLTELKPATASSTSSPPLAPFPGLSLGSPRFLPPSSVESPSSRRHWPSTASPCLEQDHQHLHTVAPSTDDIAMAGKSRFTKLDAFTKTVEDARIRTTSGGIVTIVSLIVVLFLAWGEWADYRRVVIHPELIVDKGRGERMEIHLNITFPRVPCELLTLDVMDVSGEQQHGVQHGVRKTRLRPQSEGGFPIDTKELSL